MRLQTVQDALNQKISGLNIPKKTDAEVWILCSATEIPCVGISRGVWGAETNIYEAGRSEDIEGDYEEKIAGEILSWPDMINN